MEFTVKPIFLFLSGGIFGLSCWANVGSMIGQVVETGQQPQQLQSDQNDANDLDLVSSRVLPRGARRVRFELEGGFQPLGVNLVTGSQDEAYSRGGLGEPTGVLVTAVSANGPAAAAGLRSGDLILRVDQQPLHSTEDMTAVLFSAAIGQLQQLEVFRGRQRLQIPLRLLPHERQQSACPSYTHPSEDYRFRFFSTWKLDSQLRREAVTDRPFHYLESPGNQYRIHLFVEAQPAPAAKQALLAFQQEAGSGFLEGYTQWLQLGDLPAVFVSGVVGRERLFAVYRLAVVAGEKLYEIDIYAPPHNDPAELPFVIQVLLGTLRDPKTERNLADRVATNPGETTETFGLTPPPALKSPPSEQSFAEPPKFSGLILLGSQLQNLEQQLLAADDALPLRSDSPALPRVASPAGDPPIANRVPTEATAGSSRLEELRAAIEQMESEREKASPADKRVASHGQAVAADRPMAPPIHPPTGPGQPPTVPGQPPTNFDAKPLIPSAQVIAELRRRAMEVWTPPQEIDPGDFSAEETKPMQTGWMKSEHDPGKVVDIFTSLRLKSGFVLRAYVYHEEGNASGVVWALPRDVPFPNPEEVPVLEQHLFKAPKPWDAIDDFMDIVEGDGSDWSYLAASILRRELNEFGATWHGIEWGSHCILEFDPWRATPKPTDDDLCLPTSSATEWQWQAERPQDWKPTVQVAGDYVTVTYYSYVGKYPEKIVRHTETFRTGQYRARVRDQVIGQGPGGYLF